jgi:elongation factor G
MRLRFGTYRGDKLSADYFFQATAAALRNAFSETEFALLKPVVRMRVDVPEDRVADALTDLGRRRGRVDSQEAVGSMMRVVARCPASKLLDYEVSLRSLTRGTGSVFIVYSGYKTVLRW